MLKNFAKVAICNLRKTAFYSLLNILGLSIGIASALLILLFVYQEVNYDTFHSKKDRIYRVWLNGKMAGQELNVAVSSPPVGPTAASELPEVKNFVRIENAGEQVIRFGDRVFHQEDILQVDSTFFQVFDFELLQGNADKCLSELNSAVITENLARKYFSTTDVLGKSLSIGNEEEQYKITGLVADPPSNSHMDFEMLISYPLSRFDMTELWFSNGLYTYLLVEEGTDPEVLDQKLFEMTDRHLGPLVEEIFNTSMEGFRAAGNKYGYHPQPLTDIHLGDQITDNLEVGGSSRYLYIFSFIAIFIIVIACINYMNMATAKSARRAKEVGLRKTLGSFRSQLILQFIAESVLITIISSFIALIIASLCLGPFNTISGQELNISMIWQPYVLAGIVILVIIVGLLAGSYPAFYLSHYNPAAVLKGNISSGLNSGRVRNVLVVFQFFISIFLIVSTLLIYRQVEFIRNRDLGFDKENLITLTQVNRLANNSEAFKEAVLGSSGFTHAAFSSNALPNINNKSVFREKGSMEDHIIGVYSVDHDYLETMDIELLKGRNFSRDFLTDTAAMLLNEAAVREFGLEDPLNSYISSLDSGDPNDFRVVGVIKDFNFETLKQPATPLLFILGTTGSYLTVRLPAGDHSGSVDELQQLWKEHAGDEPFNYQFVDDEYAMLFQAEKRMGTIFTVFSVLAIFIASIGLFGLAAYTAEKRTREVGIRKVMGASVWQLVLLLSKDFAVLVTIAFLISVPLVYLVMNQWLMEFAYRIEIGAGVFAIAGFLAFFIAFTTVSLQSLKAAKANPVRSLKYE